MMTPNMVEVTCAGIVIEDEEVEMATQGENVTIALKGIDEGNVHEGFVLSHTDNMTKRSQMFEGQSRSG